MNLWDKGFHATRVDNTEAEARVKPSMRRPKPELTTPGPSPAASTLQSASLAAGEREGTYLSQMSPAPRLEWRCFGPSTTLPCETRSLRTLTSQFSNLMPRPAKWCPLTSLRLLVDASNASN
jgi:hypothetical protein